MGLPPVVTNTLARARNRRAWRLRGAVADLPAPTREAMLVAVNAQQLIAGGYSSRSGGVCPMLAAHRQGASSDGRDFARAWDAFTGARVPRPATERETAILKTMLEESLFGEAPRPVDAPRQPEPSEPRREYARVV